MPDGIKWFKLKTLIMKIALCYLSKAFRKFFTTKGLEGKKEKKAAEHRAESEKVFIKRQESSQMIHIIAGAILPFSRASKH
jgi:hypothetical protein